MRACTPGRDSWPYPRQSLQKSKARGLRERGEGEERRTLTKTADAAFYGIKTTIPATAKTTAQSEMWTRMAQPVSKLQEILTEPPTEESANANEKPHWPTATTKAQRDGKAIVNLLKNRKGKKTPVKEGSLLQLDDARDAPVPSPHYVQIFAPGRDLGL